MNHQLQKRCFLASAGFHLLLVAILFLGPAFLVANKKSNDQPLIDFVPVKTIDEALSGGGNPKAQPQAPHPQPPATQPQPRIQEPAPQPEHTPAPKPQPKARQPEPKPVEHDDLAAPAKPTRRLPDVSLKPTQRFKERNSKPKTSPKQPADDSTNDRATLIAKAARSAAKSLREGAADSAVEMPELQGPGGGGITYANFLDALKKLYSDAWIVPDGVTDDQAIARASVTIAKDGTVLSWKLIKSSGSSLADSSVEMALRRVTKAVPLPEAANESQRTVTITFSVKAKRGLG